MDLTKIKHAHFIGIGGVHMSALAHMLHNQGIVVTGSDAFYSERVEKLIEAGITVYIGHKESQLSPDLELVIYNAAVQKTNVEYQEAIKRQIKLLERPELIGLLMKDFHSTIAIAGTHGKTTTTSMTAFSFVKGELDPTVLNGGFLPILNGYYREGKSPYFILEACEYKNSFLSFYPKIGVILNVEMDHPDFFQDIEAVYNSFRQFAENIPADGKLILNQSISHAEKITDTLACEIITFGRDETADVYAQEDTLIKGKGAFSLYNKGAFLGNVTLDVFGEYNIDNALATAAIWLSLGLDEKRIASLLSMFTTVNRRFEYKGCVGELEIYDDFAHHPTEIQKTIEAAKAADRGEVTVVFEPHTYQRTYTLYDDFTKAFDEANTIILLDIYSPAGREDTFPVTIEGLAADIEKRGKKVICAKTYEEAKKYINNFVHKGLLLTMGAGNVYKLGESLLSDL